jgi:signal transduction histidine kinase
MTEREHQARERDRVAPAIGPRARRLEGMVRRRERHLSVLSEVSSRIHAEDSVERILDVALESLVTGLGLETAWVFLGDERDRTLRLAAHRGVSESYLAQIAERGLDQCLCREVFTTGLGMQARNTRDCPRLPILLASGQMPLTHACIPLRLEGTSRGVLNVAPPVGQAFTDEDLRFLEIVGRQVCLAVERARHAAAERLYNQEARALATLNRAIGESLDTGAVLKAVGETALGILGVDRVQLLLGSEPRHLTVALVVGNPHPDLRQGQPVDLTTFGGSLHRRALEEQASFRVGDWRTDDRVNRGLAERWGLGSALIIPLVARRATLGLLVLSHAGSHAWTDDQVDVAETLASQASVALENARLYEKARRAYRELNEAQARIIQGEKMAAVGTFASGLAHEVRNPLNSIALQLSILERRVAPLGASISVEFKELIGVIREEVRRLDNLVGDFLLFSKANRITFRAVNLDAIIDEVVRLLRPEARASAVTLERAQRGEPAPELALDGERIKQVVINLVQNAIEAMPGGGRVTVESGLVGDNAQVVVRDSGPGLPEGVDVFQLFVTTKAQGTGLGLSIAQQIVLEHGGVISASSVPGHGATFTVTLPVLRPDEAPEGRQA